MAAKRLVIILSMHLFLSATMIAQTFSGRVIDLQSNPVSFANILLMNSDSTIITGCVSNDDGTFQLPVSDQGAIIKITLIGYNDKIQPINLNEFLLGDILLEESSLFLNEVIVKGNRPKVFIKNDALVTNVEGTLLEKAGTAQDVLGKISGLVLKGDQIHVFGRGVPHVYINNREITDPTELTQLTSDNIKSIEVITDPGARYSKSMKAVIRIQTKKKQGDGIGFNEMANVSYNDKYSFTNQLSLNYRQNKIDVNGLLSYSDQSMWRKYNSTQKTYLEQEWDQNMKAKQDARMNQLVANMTLNYNFNENHSLGINYRYARVPKSTADMNWQTNIYRDLSLFEESISTIQISNPSTRNEVNTYYNGTVGKWNIDFNGTFLKNKNLSNLQTIEQILTDTKDDQQNEIHTYTDTRNTFYAGKLTFSYPLFNGDLVFGGEYTNTQRNSLYINAENIISNDNSQIDEQLGGIFMEYKYLIGKKISLQAGIRSEMVDFKYYKDNVYQETESRNYNNWFPSFSVSMPIKSLQLRLSYSSDITRPTYDMLRNRIDYVNRYTYETGNPLLKPAMSQNITLQGSYKWLLLSANWGHRKDASIFYSKVYSLETPNIALFYQVNAPSYNMMNFLLTASPTIGIWSPQVNLEFFKQWYTAEEPGTIDKMIRLDKPSCSIYWRNSLKLPLGMILNVDFNWEGSSEQKNKSYQAVWWAGASLYKDFFANQLSILIQANDLFNTYRNKELGYHGRLRTMYLDEKYSRRFIGLTVQYKFNNTRNKYRGTGAGQDQQGRL